MTSERIRRQGVREILEDFINIYRNEPCVWQIKNKDYHNREKKTAAYNKLIEQYKKIEPTANRDMIVKKMNALRTNYRKEKKKVEESIRCGAGPDEVYVPSLWYYDLLTFLDEDQGTPTSSSSKKDENDSTPENENDPDSMDSSFLPTQVKAELANSDRDDNSSGSAFTSEQTSRPRAFKRKLKTNLTLTDLSHEVLQTVNEYFKRPSLTDDQFEIFGKNVAVKLRGLPREQRLIAEKIINDTLFDAEMGSLTLPQEQFHDYDSNSN